MEYNIRYIKSEEEEKLYIAELRIREKNFDPDSTTVSFDDCDSMEAYDYKKEYLMIVKENNHEIIYRIKYE